MVEVEEIKMYDYFRKSAADLGFDAKIDLLKLGDSGEVFYEMAMEMISCIKANNSLGKKTVFICPVGPVGQYPIFVRLVNRDNISLKNVWFLNMDEYLNDDKQWIDIEDKLSFRGYMNREVYSKINPELIMPEEQRIFPDPNRVDHISKVIDNLGGVDICFGGIGINGHIAFNEPEDISAEEFSNRATRVLEISRETRTINAVGDLNGAIEVMPKFCITIGMKEILSAKKIRLYCFRDWHRAVVRQAVYGEVSARFPVTLVQNHPDGKITVNSNAAQQPF